MVPPRALPLLSQPLVDGATVGDPGQGVLASQAQVAQQPPRQLRPDAIQFCRRKIEHPSQAPELVAIIVDELEGLLQRGVHRFEHPPTGITAAVTSGGQT